jgi:hypothetical protein
LVEPRCLTSRSPWSRRRLRASARRPLGQASMLDFTLALVGFRPSSAPRCAGSPPLVGAFGADTRSNPSSGLREFWYKFLQSPRLSVACSLPFPGKPRQKKDQPTGLLVELLARTSPVRAPRELHTGRFCPDGARSWQDPLALSLTVALAQSSRPRSPGEGSGRSPRGRPLSVLEFQVVCECTGNQILQYLKTSQSEPGNLSELQYLSLANFSI